MKFTTIIVVLVLLVIGGIVFFSIPSEMTDEEYGKILAAERMEKDDYMRSSKESPFAMDSNTFTRLEYYAPSRKYQVRAKVSRIENPKPVALPTSSGETNSYLEYAWAEFELDGVQNKLLLLEVMTMGPTRGTLFLAFADETSAHDTYGAGRYLELKKIPGQTTIELDFNRAYNPYCAYNENYSCPLPPKENVLKVAILAGEKNYPSAKP